MSRQQLIDDLHQAIVRESYRELQAALKAARARGLTEAIKCKLNGKKVELLRVAEVILKQLIEKQAREEGWKEGRERAKRAKENQRRREERQRKYRERHKWEQTKGVEVEEDDWKPLFWSILDEYLKIRLVSIRQGRLYLKQFVAKFHPDTCEQHGRVYCQPLWNKFIEIYEEAVEAERAAKEAGYARA